MSEDGRLALTEPPRKDTTTTKEEQGGVVPSPPPPPLLQITYNDEDNDEIPLAPTRIMQEKDEELLPSIKENSLTHPEKSNKCLVYMLSTIVIISILMLILGSTILRADSPNIKLRQIRVKNLRFGTSPFASVEMNMVSEVAIENNNLVGNFKFHNWSSSVFYGNVSVGISDINGGNVLEARGNQLLNVTVLVGSNNSDALLLNNSNSSGNFSSDIVSKLVPLRSVTNLRGEVEIMNIFHSKTSALLNCSMSLNLSSQAFQDLNCN